MKFLKVLVVVSMLLGFQLFAKNITVKDFSENRPSTEDISKANLIYADCLENYNNHCCDAIIMVLIKQKILYPESDYECLIKPLKKIISKTDNEKLRNNATTALVILSKDFDLVLDEEQLYNFQADRFFDYINYQLPKEILFSKNSQNFENK